MKKRQLFHPPFFLLHSHLSPPRLKLSFTISSCEEYPVIMKLKFTMDKSWLELDRGDSRYVQGRVDFVEFTKQNGENTQVCPCKRCLLVKGRLSLKKMFVHLINYGMMKGYKTWTSHGGNSNEPLPYMLRQQWLAERYGESSSDASTTKPNHGYSSRSVSLSK
ncbi:hypothetical protein QQ045_018477 [Rhodiola kirilowii]